ncbi:MAG TPA: hypothetical protein VHG08_06910, partial [Longimicrobium sp.]|nr:hypothetical protein [Longimicrobium sp.]
MQPAQAAFAHFQRRIHSLRRRGRGDSRFSFARGIIRRSNFTKSACAQYRLLCSPQGSRLPPDPNLREARMARVSKVRHDGDRLTDLMNIGVL